MSTTKDGYAGNHTQDTITYAGAPCWTCMDYTCPNADNKGICPESSDYPNDSPDWCNCTSELLKCPWNAAIHADADPPSGEVLRAFHAQLRRQNARDGLRTSVACLRRWPDRRHHWRQVPREAADLIRAYWGTRGGSR